MPHLLSCLGREPLLCAAELAAVLDRHNVRFVAFHSPGELAWVETEGTIDLSALQAELGGTVKLAQAVPVGERSITDAVDELVDRYLTDEHRGGKFHFGVSVYRLSSTRAPHVRALIALRETLEQHIKERHTATGAGARFVPPTGRDETALSSAQVLANRLVDGGLELIVGVDESGRAVVVGRTRAVQPIDQFVETDAARTHERFRQGVVPQKLARILVNLARTRSAVTLLDPFCGAGTIAGQALLVGLVPLATDVDFAAVQATAQYLAQLGAATRGEKTPVVERQDVKTLSRRFAPLSVDCVACEPYLGPPLRSRPAKERAHALAEECRQLYVDALAEIRTVLRPGGRVVWISPAWDCGDGVVRTRLARDFYLLGFSPARPGSAWGDRRTRPLSYHRPGAIVQRTIHILQN